MDTKALRQKILDLAIRGKLVPQDPNDEPASVLLERIRAEKQQMVKDGKLKAKDIKNDTVIFKGDDNLHYEQFQDGTVKCIEDEIPFELPDGWAWARLKELFNVCSSKRVLQSDWKKEGVPFYRAREIVKLSDNGFVDNELFISEEHFLSLSRDYGVPQPGDLMVSGVGTIGKIYIVKPSDHFYYKDASVLCFENRNNVVISEFARILLESSFVQHQMKDNSKGTTVDTITISAATNYLCVIPPINEQIRIIDIVENALVYVDTVCKNKESLHATLTTAKSKILDLAIRGKLVPQDPNDEPASVLLERIRAEKEELIKQGKIKRDKKESVIFKGDDNSYYQDLPQNWQVSTLREVTTPLTLNDGDWILSENMTDNGEVKLLQLGSIGNMSYIDKGFKYLTKDTFDELSCTEIFAGYLIINRIISDKMCCCIVPDIDGTIITTVDTCWIAPSETSYDIKFLMYQLASPSFQSAVLLKATGTTRKRISKNNLIDLHLLLPPLAEQRRIVHTIEALFAQIDKISEQIS